MSDFPEICLARHGCPAGETIDDIATRADQVDEA